MQITDITKYSTQLFEEMGPKSIAVAAGRAQKAEEDGKPDDATTWRKIERALMEMRGPHQG